MAGTIACRYVHGLWSQMRVRKRKKTHQVQMVDAKACGRIADSEGKETRKKERKKLKLTGCGWLTRLRVDAFHVRGLWTRMRVTKKVKVKTYQVRIVDTVFCRRRYGSSRHG